MNKFQTKYKVFIWFLYFPSEKVENGLFLSYSNLEKTVNNIFRQTKMLDPFKNILKNHDVNHNDVSLLFKLWLFDLADLIVWNIKGELLEFEPSCHSFFVRSRFMNR